MSHAFKPSNRLACGLKKWGKLLLSRNAVNLSRRCTSNSPLPISCLSARDVDSKCQKNTILMEWDVKTFESWKYFSLRAFRMTIHCLSLGPVSENNKNSALPKVIWNAITSLSIAGPVSSHKGCRYQGVNAIACTDFIVGHCLFLWSQFSIATAGQLHSNTTWTLKMRAGQKDELQLMRFTHNICAVVIAFPDQVFGSNGNISRWSQIFLKNVTSSDAESSTSCLVSDLWTISMPPGFFA